MSNKYICIDCHAQMVPLNIAPGSFFLEVLLWLFFLVPGIIYSLWRLTSKHKACSVCRGKRLVPLNSKEGQVLAEGVSNTHSGSDITDQIRKLSELRDCGALTEDEFAAKKTALLEKL